MMLWQTPAWEAFQLALGLKVTRIGGILVIERALPGGKCSLHIQRAAPNAAEWRELIAFASKRQAVAIHFAPATQTPELPSLPIRLIKPSVFPEATRIVDLSPDEAAIRAQFSSSGKRHLRIAENAGILVRESEDVAAYADLARKTAARDGFRAHGQPYFETFLRVLRPAGARLLVAEKDGCLLAAGIFLLAPPTAIYYYGASDEHHREANAPMLLQWRAMQMAKANGCEEYDLLGVAADEEDSGDRLFGVSRFKRKFGGEIVRYHPEVNLVLRPFWYAIIAFLKRLRRLLRPA